MKTITRAVAVPLVAVALVAGGGVAVAAADGSGDARPAEQCDQVVLTNTTQDAAGNMEYHYSVNGKEFLLATAPAPDQCVLHGIRYGSSHSTR